MMDFRYYLRSIEAADCKNLLVPGFLSNGPAYAMKSMNSGNKRGNTNQKQSREDISMPPHLQKTARILINPGELQQARHVRPKKKTDTDSDVAMGKAKPELF